MADVDAVTTAITGLIFAVSNSTNVDFTLTHQNLTTADFSNYTFDVTNDVKIFCHDYKAQNEWYQDMIDQYSISEYYYIFAANYTDMLDGVPATSVPQYVKAIGDAVGDFVIDLKKKHDLDLDRVHILGHKFGAHVAGRAGERVKKITGKTVGRITGLDPSASTYAESNRLSSDDAKFVDVIHASHDNLLEAIGTVDFWMDPFARRCDAEEFRKLDEVAPKLYASTINGQGFMMDKCVSDTVYTPECEKTFAMMGEYVNKEISGRYFGGWTDKESDRFCKALGVTPRDVSLKEWEEKRN